METMMELPTKLFFINLFVMFCLGPINDLLDDRIWDFMPVISRAYVFLTVVSIPAWAIWATAT